VKKGWLGEKEDDKYLPKPLTSEYDCPFSPTGLLWGVRVVTFPCVVWI